MIPVRLSKALSMYRGALVWIRGDSVLGWHTGMIRAIVGIDREGYFRILKLTMEWN